MVIANWLATKEATSEPNSDAVANAILAKSPGMILSRRGYVYTHVSHQCHEILVF